MTSTVSDFATTVCVEQIRTKVLENMIIYMYSQISKISKEIILVGEELKRRDNLR